MLNASPDLRPRHLSSLAGGLLLFALVKELLTWEEWSWGLLFLLVALLGIPHGAMDHRIGRFWMEPTQGRWWWVTFGAFYLGALGGVISSWLLWPQATLGAFLLLSVLHFGQEDMGPLFEKPGVLYWAFVAFRGMLPLTAAAHFEEGVTAQLFTPLLLHPGAAEAASQLARWGAAAFVPVILLGLASYILWWRQGAQADVWGTHLLESGLILLCFALFSPLEGFVLYFCFHHAVRHTREMAPWMFPEVTNPLSHFWQQSLLLSTSTLAGAGLAFLWLSGQPLEHASLQVLFIGLASLTLPHVLLHWLAFDFHRPFPSSSNPKHEVP